MIEVKPEHLTLDRNHLEQAVLNQASLFDLYATECSKQESKVARLRNTLEYKTALFRIEIRKNADAAKVKLVLDQIDCAVAVEPEIVQLKEEIVDAEEYLGQLKAAVEALRHKRDSIANEVRLVATKFFLTDGDCDPDTKYEAQVKAVEEATQRSLEGR